METYCYGKKTRQKIVEIQIKYIYIYMSMTVVLRDSAGEKKTYIIL